MKILLHQSVFVQVEVVETSSSVWKTGALTVVLHLRGRLFGESVRDSPVWNWRLFSVVNPWGRLVN
jgi:hypothetical protein